MRLPSSTAENNSCNSNSVQIGRWRPWASTKAPPKKQQTNRKMTDRVSLFKLCDSENKQKRTFAIKQMFGVGSMPPRRQARKCVQEWSSRPLSSLNTWLIGKRSFGALSYDGSDCHHESVRSSNPGCVFYRGELPRKRRRSHKLLSVKHQTAS